MVEARERERVRERVRERERKKSCCRMDQRREIKRLIIVSSFAITVTITHQDTHLISKSLCCANYTRKIIHSFNLTNTFYDLLRHRYMSPDSHMKKGLNSYCWIRIPICYQLSHLCLSIIEIL